ncbi:MAG: glycosyltransferase family 39 protein [Candidatus Omnitrophota bacterium]
MPKDLLDRMSHRTLIVILVAISYFILMFGNGLVTLTHPDEVFYAQTAKEMIAQRSWLTPLMFGTPQFEKPIFCYWLMAGVVQLFGLGPFVVRFWPAFFGILGVGTTYWMAWMLFNDKKIAFLSGIILCTSFIYLALSRAVLTDMVFSILVVLSLAFFCQGYYYRQHKNSGIILSFVFSGLAVLAKGILGLCFPFLAILAFLIYKKDIKFLMTKATAWGIFFFMLIAAPWHLLMYKWYGQDFINEYWVNVHVRRLFVAEHPRNDTWYFYLMLMVVGVMPWSFFVFPAGYRFYKNIKNVPADRDRLLLLFFWVLSVYLFVHPAHSKLASYIFPVFPAIAIILAYYFIYLFNRRKGTSFPLSFRIVGLLMSGCLFLGSIAAIFFGRQYFHLIGSMFPVYAFALCFLSLSLALFIATLKERFFLMMLANSGLTVIILLSLFLARPLAEPWVSCHDICRVFKEMDVPQGTVLASKFYVRGVRYYTDRDVAVVDNGRGFFSPHPIPYLNTNEKVLDFLQKQPITYGIVKEGDREYLSDVTHGAFRIVDLYNVGGKYIIKIIKI